MVLELKAMFESRGLSVSILYGGLSPRFAATKRDVSAMENPILSAQPMQLASGLICRSIESSFTTDNLM